MNRETRRALAFKKNSQVQQIKHDIDLMDQIAEMSIPQLLALRSQAKQRKAKGGQ